MSGSWMFVAALLVAAVVPFALLGAIRFVAWAAPSHLSWLADLERRHYRSFWYFIAVTYLVAGVAHFIRPRGEPIFGTMFIALGLVSLVRALRGRPQSPTTREGR